MSTEFWEQVITRKTSECWLWNGQHDDDSRPVFKGEKAYRYAYRLRKGDLYDGNHVHHKCENCACVNPHRLIQLTPENHREAHRAIRSGNQETLREIYDGTWGINYEEEQRKREEAQPTFNDLEVGRGFYFHANDSSRFIKTGINTVSWFGSKYQLPMTSFGTGFSHSQGPLDLNSKIIPYPAHPSDKDHLEEILKKEKLRSTLWGRLWDDGTLNLAVVPILAIIFWTWAEIVHPGAIMHSLHLIK